MLYSTHPDIRNKPDLWQASFGDNWQRNEGELIDLQDHVSNGGAFIGAAMSSQHRSSQAFVSSELAVIDVDHGLSITDFMEHPMAQHAAWVYTTCSHTDEENRYRVIFRLPELITKADVYKELITALVSSLGGDKACTDACRLYYGNDKAQHPLWQPKATLPASFLLDALKAAEQQHDRFDITQTDFDDNEIAKAIFCLEQVIEPTSDGERGTKFLPITMACNTVGPALFPAWSDWASRGYHGKKGQQSSEKFFRGAVSRKHGIGTLFYHANKDNPDWYKDLPDELKDSKRRFSIWEANGVSGYEPEDFDQDNWEEAEAAAWDKVLEEVDRRVETGDFQEPDHVLNFAYDDNDYSPSDRLVALAEEEDFELPPEPDFDDIDDESNTSGGTDKDGKTHTILRCLNAVDLALPDLRENVISGEFEWGSLSKPRSISVDEIDRLYIDVAGQSVEEFSKISVKDCVLKRATANKHSPIRKYLNYCATLPPIDYLTTFASTIFGLPEEGPLNPRMESGQLLADAVMQRFFIGAVDRAFNPGCVHDWMPILVGSQACGKSSFLKYIVPSGGPAAKVPYPWATTLQQDLASLSNKPHKLHAGWIVILDECERYFDKRHIERLKNLISTPVDRSDLKYRNESSFPRNFVLAGACNSVDFLTDPTGNRRFMPIPITGVVNQKGRKQIDLDRVKRDRDRIWAAAYHAFQDNPVHTFDSAEIAETQEYVATFQVDNPLDQQILHLTASKLSGTRLNKRDGKEQNYWTVHDLMEWMDIPKAQQPSMTVHVTDSLKRFGFERVRHLRPGHKNATSCWVRGLNCQG